MATARRPLVVVGFAEAASAPEVVWSLVDAGYRVKAFARRGRSAALRRSRHVSCFEISAPESDATAAATDLRSWLGQADDAPVLFPLDDAAVWLCGQVEVPAGGRVVGATGATADLALDKERQVAAATQAGLLVPPTAVVRTVAELDDIADRFPLMLKPAMCARIDAGRLRRGRHWIVNDRDELTRAGTAWAGQGPLLVQPFIEGVGEGIFGLAAADGVRAWSAHRRLRMMNPHGSGSSACVSREVDVDLREAVARLIAQTGWRGLFMIEWLRDAAGRAWFVEMNGRPWGSMALARRQGLEYPAWHVSLAVDPQSGVGRVERKRPGLVCRHLGREAMHLLFVLRGPKSSALRGWPSPWASLKGVLSIRPGDGIYNWRRDDPYVFLDDCYRSVHDNVFKRGH